MKGFSVVIFFVAIVSYSLGQSAPLAFTYSGVARDQSGNLITNQAIGIQISIIETSVFGPPVFTENHAINTDSYGLFTVIVGTGNQQSGDISDINWGANNYFLQVAMDVNGGTDFQNMGISQLLSVPYALHARTAESLSGQNSFSGSYFDLENLPSLSPVAYSGNFNDLANSPENPSVPNAVSAFNNDVGYVTTNNDNQQLSVSFIGDTLFLSNTNWIIIPGISEANFPSNGIYSPGPGVSDIDGNSYASIIINGGEWMAENLRTTAYANGDEIPNIQPALDWTIQTQGAWSYYNNDPSFDIPYGKLYNWMAVNDPRNVCPSGWHVPSLIEWTQLTDFLGGFDVAGGKMKSTGLQYWIEPNAGATNESGFNGIPAGDRGTDFSGMGYYSEWWTSTLFTSDLARGVNLYYIGASAGTPNYTLEYGLSIRCKRD